MKKMMPPPTDDAPALPVKDSTVGKDTMAPKKDSIKK